MNRGKQKILDGCFSFGNSKKKPKKGRENLKFEKLAEKRAVFWASAEVLGGIWKWAVYFKMGWIIFGLVIFVLLVYFILR